MIIVRSRPESACSTRLQAVLVQAVVMFPVLAATATVVIAPGLVRRLFTPAHRLLYLPTPADH
jgi:ABC-type iron transport system FetAB permease component